MARYNPGKRRKGKRLALALAAVIVVLAFGVWMYATRSDIKPTELASPDDWQTPSAEAPSSPGETADEGEGAESPPATNDAAAAPDVPAQASGQPATPQKGGQAVDPPQGGGTPSATPAPTPADSSGETEQPSEGEPSVGNGTEGEPPATDSGTKGGTASSSQAPAPSGDDPAKERQRIDTKYETEILKLRAKCVSQSQHLLSGMLSEIKGNEDATAELLESKYLDDLIAAEASCDSSFQSLLDGAATDYEQAGIDPGLLPDWTAQYESEKTNARLNAIAKLSAAIQD